MRLPQPNAFFPTCPFGLEYEVVAKINRQRKRSRSGFFKADNVKLRSDDAACRLKINVKML